MSGHSGGPAPKKMKQVLLGQWLHQSDGSKPAAVNGSAAPSPARSPHGSGGRGSGSSGGGGGGDAWAKYQAPRGGHRSGSSARDQRSAHSNSSITSGSSYSKGVERAAANHRHSSARGGQAFDTGGGGSAIDLSADDNGDVGKGVEAGAEGGKAEAIPYPAGMGDILEGLCEEQRHVIDLVLKGKSVFFTGAAGTGKSFLLKKLHQALRQADQGATTFMTGTTGKAAVGIGGCTIHSFAGIGLGKDSVEQLVGRVKRSRNAQKRWAQCKVLVIDEISMMEADLFDKLNLVGQRVKGNGQPFGGIQLVLCGDFFQLPPVGIGRGSTRFCFEAKTWDTSIDQSIVLKQVFRQKDPFFLKILHEMREGRVSSEAEQVLADKVEQCRFERYQQINAKSTGGISAAAPAESGSGGGEASSPASPSGRGGGARGGAGEGGGGPPAEPSVVAPPPPPPPSYTRLFSRNEDVDRLNVEELQKLQGRAELYEAEDNGDQMYLTQLQKHCAAGQTIELKVGAKVLLLKNLDSSSQLVNGATGVVTEFVEASGRRLPMVEFDTIEGGGKVASVISEEEWTVSLGDREMARRVQLPLRLAWALSVHKSQGMTIAHVMVSTRGMFEFGQAYVALSRATTLDGLHLVEFQKGVVKAHESVKKFYAGLEESCPRMLEQRGHRGSAPGKGGAQTRRVDLPLFFNCDSGVTVGDSSLFSMDIGLSFGDSGFFDVDSGLSAVRLDHGWRRVALWAGPRGWYQRAHTWRRQRSWSGDGNVARSAGANGREQEARAGKAGRKEAGEGSRDCLLRGRCLGHRVMEGASGVSFDKRTHLSSGLGSVDLHFDWVYRLGSKGSSSTGCVGLPVAQLPCR